MTNDMAIKALSQQPCDDTVSIRKDVLKYRVGKLVVYNVEWLKKHWQMEMDIVCGVKPCDDAISRLDKIRQIIAIPNSVIQEDVMKYKMICEVMKDKLPSVTQKSGNDKKCGGSKSLYKPKQKLEPCDDAISREAVLRLIENKPYDWSNLTERHNMLMEIRKLPSVTHKSGKCKNCKYFEYDSVAKVDGVPLIVAHEICNKWGDGCKTKEDGYCFLFEPQESEEISETNMKMWEELFKAESEGKE